MGNFVTFEIAKKLKEKGFVQGFNVYGIRPIYCNPDTIKFISDIGAYEAEYFGENISCPTISQVLKWLREEKDIDLVISPVFFYDGVLGKMREYGCKVFAPSLNKPEHCGYHEEWEQAAIAGIEYVLYNLI